MGRQRFIIDHEYMTRALVPDLELPGVHPNDPPVVIKSVRHINPPRLQGRTADGEEVWSIDVEERDKSWAKAAGVPILRRRYRTTAAGAAMLRQWLRAHQDERHAEDAIKQYLIRVQGWGAQEAHRVSRRPFIGDEKVKVFREWMKHIGYAPDQRARRDDWQEHETDAIAYNSQLQKVHEVAFLVTLEGDVESRPEPYVWSRTERMLYKEIREAGESHGIPYVKWTEVIQEREERQRKAKENSVIYVDLLEARPETHRVEIRIAVRGRDARKAATVLCRMVRMEELKDGTTGVVETAEPDTETVMWGKEREDADAIRECVRRVVDTLGWKLQMGEDVTAGSAKRIAEERGKRTLEP